MARWAVQPGVSSRLVKFEQMGDGSLGGANDGDIALIDQGAVGAVIPHSDYTTLLVQGKYVHVKGQAPEVLSKLGWLPEEPR